VAAGRIVRTLARTQEHRSIRAAGPIWTRFDPPLFLFLISAALGGWLAFDQAAASAKFWQIVGGLALYDSLVFVPDQTAVFGRRFSPVPWLLLLLPAMIAAYSMLTSDWSLVIGKAPWLNPAASWFAFWQPGVPADRLHPNVAGGLIAAMIPLQVAAAGSVRRLPPATAAGAGGPVERSSWGAARVGAWLLVGLSFLGLLMSASRGAWLALGAVGGLWLLWRVRGHRWSRRTWLVLAVFAISALALGAVLVWTWGPVLSPGGRVALLHGSVDLLMDTPFTGIGLGKGLFQMAYSSYVLLIHVGHTNHSHVLPLDIWLEQGLLGLAACVWLLVSAVRARYVSPVWRAAGLASLGVLLLHGLVDDPFYASRGVVLLFVALAVLAREDLRVPRRPAPAFKPIASAAALFATLLLLLLLLPPARAAFQANLGALAQTRAELSVYHWPEWPIQDALRRSPTVELGPAIARYRAALALNPENATANRRLGQIELSRGEYETARAHLEAAYVVAPEQRATRQMLGEARAITGDLREASSLWEGLDLSAGQVPARVWWYEHLGEEANARRVQQAAAGQGQ
jgi:hypothetical protein